MYLPRLVIIISSRLTVINKIINRAKHAKGSGPCKRLSPPVVNAITCSSVNV